MNCFDCLARGALTPAVAICVSCGAALCADCVRSQTRETASAATPGNPLHHATRNLVCVACYRAVHAAA